jgi:RNA binding exosome subunit
MAYGFNFPHSTEDIDKVISQMILDTLRVVSRMAYGFNFPHSTEDIDKVISQISN